MSIVQGRSTVDRLERLGLSTLTVADKHLSDSLTLCDQMLGFLSSLYRTDRRAEWNRTLVQTNQSLKPSVKASLL